MYLLDTNILIEYLLDQPKADDCGKLLTKVSKGEVDAVMTRFSIHAIEAVYRGDGLRQLLLDIDRSLGLLVRETTTGEEAEVALLSKTIRRDFDDSLQFYVAKLMGADAIVSLDKHLDGLGIRRIEPAEALRETL